MTIKVANFFSLSRNIKGEKFDLGLENVRMINSEIMLRTSFLKYSSDNKRERE